MHFIRRHSIMSIIIGMCFSNWKTSSKWNIIQLKNLYTSLLWSTLYSITAQSISVNMSNTRILISDVILMMYSLTAPLTVNTIFSNVCPGLYYGTTISYVPNQKIPQASEKHPGNCHSHLLFFFFFFFYLVLLYIIEHKCVLSD